MKPTIRRSAEDDILREIDRYAMLDLPQVANNFKTAVVEALDLLCLTPDAGAPRLVPNTKLEGLRTWPIKGFDAFRIYDVAAPGSLDVVRVLHGRRDIARILLEEG